MDGCQRGTLSWLLNTLLDTPCPPGLEWMTPDELDGYYLLFSDIVPTPGLPFLVTVRHGTPRAARGSSSWITG
jgi:hypothetical protein